MQRASPPPLKRFCPPNRRYVGLVGWVGLLCGALGTGASWAQDPPACRLEILIESHPSPDKLTKKLQEDARRLGACTRPWALRISPGPKKQYVLALWNGSSLETRWASDAEEVEAVAEMLLRVTVEQAPPEPTTSTPSASAPSPPSPPSSSELPPPPPPPSPAPTSSLLLGPVMSVGWYTHLGVGIEGGAVFRYGSSWGVGAQPSVGRVLGSSANRTDLRLLITGSYLARFGKDLRLGLGLGVGPEVSWVSGKDQGVSLEERAVGLQFGGGPEALVGDRVWLAIPVRYSTTNTPVMQTTVQTTVDKNNPGQGQGQGRGNKTTTTTTTTTEPTLSGKMGGLSFSLQFGWMF